MKFKWDAGWALLAVMVLIILYFLLKSFGLF